jgi:hypothetical protein
MRMDIGAQEADSGLWSYACIRPIIIIANVRFDVRRQTTAGFLANHLVSSAKPAVRTSTVLKLKS